MTDFPPLGPAELAALRYVRQEFRAGRAVVNRVELGNRLRRAGYCRRSSTTPVLLALEARGVLIALPLPNRPDDSPSITRMKQQLYHEMGPGLWRIGPGALVPVRRFVASAAQPPAARRATEVGPPTQANLTARRGKNIDARMLKLMAEVPESLGWSARQWAERLACAKSTVAATQTWTVRLSTARAFAAADRAERTDQTAAGRRAKRTYRA